MKFTGNDPLGFVLSQNIHRRQLDPSQLAMIAARLANMRQVNAPISNLPQICGRSRGSRPETQRVRTFGVCRRLCGNATPELVRAVEQGKVAVSVAAGLAGSPKAVQRKRSPTLIALMSSPSRSRALASTCSRGSNCRGASRKSSA